MSVNPELVGREFPPTAPYLVGREKVREFARAVFATDPQHEDPTAAQALGYAEADPTADVEGFDAAQKAAILASLAFHTAVPLEAVHREGITKIDKQMMDAARHAGFVIKLLAVCERLEGAPRYPAEPAAEATADGEAISVRVYPALVPRDHPLASVHGANNAVFVEAEAAGSLMFYGAGAGGVQTASAVLGDVVSAARRHIAGCVGVGESTRANLPVVPIGRVTTSYQITLEVDDRPGVLATVAGILSEGRVSIATVEQTIVADGKTLWLHDVDLNQVTARQQEQVLGATPAAIVAAAPDLKALEKDFTLTEEPDSVGQQWVKAVPKSRDGQLQSIRVGLKPAAGGAELGTLDILDSFGQRSVLTFSNFEVNAAVPASHFQFTPPKGADVLRN